MILYSIIIVVGTILCALLNIFFNPVGEPWYIYAAYSVAITLALILIDGLVAAIIRKIPEKYFLKDRKIFQLSERQRKFCDFLGVKKWKEKIPELGGFTNFHKDHVKDPFDIDYVRRFILEARYGVIIHLWSVPFGFLVVLFDFKMYFGQGNIFWTIAIPLALVNAILIVAPAFVLKYNLPKLDKLLRHNTRLRDSANKKSPN